jgi:hypothetical protein
MDLEKKIRNEFSKFEVFKSVNKFIEETRKYADGLQPGDKLIVKKTYASVGFSARYGGHMCNGLVLYLKAKEFKEPLQILCMDAAGDMLYDINWKYFYPSLIDRREKSNEKKP